MDWTTIPVKRIHLGDSIEMYPDISLVFSSNSKTVIYFEIFLVGAIIDTNIHNATVILDESLGSYGIQTFSRAVAGQSSTLLIEPQTATARVGNNKLVIPLTLPEALPKAYDYGIGSMGHIKITFSN